MKPTRLLFLYLAIPLLTSVAHNYYVSVTQVQFVKDKQSVQIISRIDFDDLEYTLQQRYDEAIDMTTLNEKPMVNSYIEEYLRHTFKIKINTQELAFNYLGKEYDNDQVVCYLEIENVKTIATIEIKNMLLYDLFPKQKNVVKTKINSKEDNLIFTKDNQNQYLNYN